MSKSFNLLAYLLRLAIADSGGQYVSQLKNPGLLSVEDWYEAYHLAVKHAVIALAWEGVVRIQAEDPLCLQNLPAELMGKWFADVQTIETENLHLEHRVAQLQVFLQKGGFASELLKGASFAAYYPNPAHRQSSDIDMWVLPKHGQKLSEHRHALIAYLLERDIPIGEVVYHHIDAKVFDDTNTELHVSPTWLYSPIRNIRLQKLFAQVRQLSPDLQELYALLHAFRHIYHDGIALRHVLDYYLISSHNRQNGIASPEMLYKQLGLKSFAQTMNEVAGFCFGGHVADTTSGEPLSLPARHLIQVLPYRNVTCAVLCDYKQETLCSLPWRAVHFLWRRWHKFN